MQGTIAIADYSWYQRLMALPELEEVNFWKPSSTRAFHAPQFSPFLFKLRAPHHAICGFGYFARYARLPDWLAWEAFTVGNGCETIREMRERIAVIRERIRFKGARGAVEIGCILIVQPVFFPSERWVQAPRDWPVRTQSDKRYDLATGEGARVWQECLQAAGAIRAGTSSVVSASVSGPTGPRYGAPVLVAPRLGQGTFRIAVTDAYQRACAVTGEHSLPALEAVHIRPYVEQGPHEVRNGILLRADLHRLFDQGYVTIAADFRLEVSGRLRQEFQNGRSYYPLHGRALELPANSQDRPHPAFLEWHRNHVFVG